MDKTKTRSAKKITDAVKKIVESAVSVKKPGLGQEELSRRIQEKAYELYQSRGANHGDDQADWYEAERIVRTQIGRR